MDWLHVIGWVVGAAAMITAALLATLVLAPAQVVAETELRDLRVRARVEARLGLGLIVVRRGWSGPLQVSLLGVRVWFAKTAEESLGAKLWRRLEDPERRAALAARARRQWERAKALVPHWRALWAEGLRFWRATSLRAEIGGTVGFDDPADTVVFFEILRYVVPRGPRIEVALCREYFDEILELDAHVRLRAWPVTMALIAARALTRRAVWRALLDVRRAGAELT